MNISVNKNQQIVTLISMVILLAMISWTAFFNPTIPLLSFTGITLAITGSYLWSVWVFNRSGKPVVYFSPDQLVLNTGTLKGLSIHWNDIQDIQEKETLCGDEKVLLLSLKEPGTYIEKAKGIQKTRMRRNLQAYGTPMVLSAFELMVHYPELKDSILKATNNRM